jgi:hypothetical protein
MSTTTLTELEEAYAIGFGIVLGKASRSDNLGVLQVTASNGTEVEVVLGTSRNGPFNVMAFFAAGLGAAVLGKLPGAWDIACYDGKASRDYGGLIRITPDRGGADLTVTDEVAGLTATVQMDTQACRDAVVVAAGLLMDM